MIPVVHSELDALSEKRWSAYKAAAEAGNVVCGEDDDAAKEMRRVFALSEFIATSCRNLPSLPGILFGEEGGWIPVEPTRTIGVVFDVPSRPLTGLRVPLLRTRVCPNRWERSCVDSVGRKW